MVPGATTGNGEAKHCSIKVVDSIWSGKREVHMLLELRCVAAPTGGAEESPHSQTFHYQLDMICAPVNQLHIAAIGLAHNILAHPVLEWFLQRTRISDTPLESLIADHSGRPACLVHKQLCPETGLFLRLRSLACRNTKDLSDVLLTRDAGRYLRFLDVPASWGSEQLSLAQMAEGMVKSRYFNGTEGVLRGFARDRATSEKPLEARLCQLLLGMIPAKEDAAAGGGEEEAAPAPSNIARRRCRAGEGDKLVIEVGFPSLLECLGLGAKLATDAALEFLPRARTEPVKKTLSMSM